MARKQIDRPIQIPFDFLAQTSKTFNRNVRIYSLWNKGYTMTSIADILGISRGQIGKILRGKGGLEHRQQYGKQWKKDNAAIVSQYNKSYYNSNIEYMKEKNQRFVEQNPDYHSTYIRNRREHYNGLVRKWSHTPKGQISRRRTKRLRRAKRKGLVLGYVPENIDSVLFENQIGICVLCSYPMSTEEVLEIDHIIPLSREGSMECICNLQLTHRSCNRRKLNRLELELSSDFFSVKYEKYK